MLRITRLFLLIFPLCMAWPEIQSVSPGGPFHHNLLAEQLPAGGGPPQSEPGRTNASAPVVVSFGSGTGVSPVNGHGQDGRATANDTTTSAPVGADFQTVGVTDYLPVFSDRLSERLTFPLSWLSGNYHDFNSWRKLARAKVMECLLAAPPSAPFRPAIVAEQDRGTYIARKVALNLTGDSRVLSFILIPKGKGPFPAVLLLHDHGARFDIGKEKVIRPWDEPPEKMKSAQEWVDQTYGGRFIGDELAKRGYVCFATDALNWSDRGGAGYAGQQALASNLLNFGMSLAGLIAHEDLRAAEFLASLPEVDTKRIAAMGLSMGAFRTWQIAALSDSISAGVAICWLATEKGLMVKSNNQARGQSSFTMTHPGLTNYLDYADVASIACPKPMLFYNGEKDALFPVPSVQEAYAKLHKVWESQGAGDRLETKLWPVAHVFSLEMQEAAFAWLDQHLNRCSPMQHPVVGVLRLAE